MQNIVIVKIPENIECQTDSSVDLTSSLCLDDKPLLSFLPSTFPPHKHSNSYNVLLGVISSPAVCVD